MCLFPRFIKNKRYQGYSAKRPSKGTATAVPCDDYRKLYVPIGCGECYECRKQKAQAWKVRLNEEIKVQKYAYFVTLTFSNEDLKKIMNETGQSECNGIATLAVRRFLERWRKKNKKSVKHWLITELGHENTERIHLHGILFTDYPINNNYLQDLWKYGNTDIGEYCNERTINYIVKYVTKIDTNHKHYKAVILCSAGLGENFVHTLAAKNTYRYKPQKSAEFYTLPNGNKVALPIYYRNKLYTQEERDKLWTERLDRNEIYVNGIKVRLRTDEDYKYYYNLLEEQQRQNNALGYGNTDKQWEKKDYNANLMVVNKKNV